MRNSMAALGLLAVISLTGCVGLVTDLLAPEIDNVVADDKFIPDPNFGSGQPERLLAKPFSATNIANLPGVIWLELVVGPQSIRAGSASGFMVEFAGKPHVLSAGHISKSHGRPFMAIYAYFSEGQNRPEELEIVVADEDLDFALLRFKNPNFRYTASYPKLGSSAALRRGDKIFPFGSPFGYDFSVREGVVTKLDFGPNQRMVIQPQLIMHDATCNPGDSGGPIFNEWGEVVGITVLGINPMPNNRFTTTIPGAIPIDDVKLVLRRVKKAGYVKHGRMGWRLYPTSGLNPLNYKDKGIAEPRLGGLMVYDLRASGAAAQAGIKIGDIVLSYDGRAANSNNEAARYFIFDRSPGDTVGIRVYRETHWTEQEIKPDAKGYLTVYSVPKMKSEELTIMVKLE